MKTNDKSSSFKISSLTQLNYDCPSSFLKILADITTVLSHIPIEAIDKAMTQILEDMGEFFQAERIGIFLFSKDSVTLENSHMWSQSNIEYQRKSFQNLSKNTISWLILKIEKGDILHISDIEILPFENKLEKIEFAHQGIRSLLVCPLMYNYQLLGFLRFDRILRKKEWTQKQIEALAIIANILAGTFAHKATQMFLREKESLYNSAMDNGQALIWMAGLDKGCYYFNKPWFDFTGRTLSEEFGNGWAEGVHKDDLHHCLDIYNTAFELHEKFSMIYRLRHHDGSYRWILDDGSPRFDRDGNFMGYIGHCLDVTERIVSEKYEQFRSHILGLIASGEQLPIILKEIVKGIEQFNPAMLCSILLLDSKGMCLGKGVAPSLPDFYNAAIEGIAIGMGIGSCGEAAFLGKRVIVEDIMTHPNWEPFKKLASCAKLGSCWSEPIVSSTSEVLGTFAIYHHEAHTPLKYDIAIIEQVARLSSIAIEKSMDAQKLSDSEKRFRTLMENIPSVAVQGYNLDGSVTFWNQASEQLYGYSKKDVIGANLLDLIIPKEMTQGVKGAMQYMSETGEPIPAGELLLQKKDGSRVPVFSSHALVKAMNKLPELFCLDIDLTEQKRAEEELRLAASVFTNAREGILITDIEGIIINANSAFSRITGYTHDEILGKKPSILKSGRHDDLFYEYMWRDLIEKGHWYGEIWNRRKNGEVYVEMVTISAIRDEQGITRQYMALFSDITIVKEHERQLEYIAYHDALTGLSNRVLLADRIHQGMTQAKRREEIMVIAYLDLDGFKIINDRYGHEMGDQLLIALATRMKLSLREGDTLARLGGDEFVAVLTDMEDIESSMPMIERLLEAAAQPVTIGKYVLQVSASIGVTFYSQTEEMEADQLLRQADQAMYQAKLAGKNRCHIFDAEQDRSIRGYHESIERIRHALFANEFVLHYQPKVNMRTGKLIGAEALIRWEHPEKSLLLPGMFLPVIEEHPLAIDVGEWVIDTALAQISQWQALGLEIPISVNIGARQLQQVDFVGRLRTLLSAYPNMTPFSLELEILETSTLENLAGVSKIIEECRSLGVSFALDDFGTGYSSLTYLKQLPVTLLKIDQSFVHDMLDDPNDLAILEGVLGLANAFHRQVIAEGVETEDEGKMLLQLGCELAQGYGIARPMPASKFLDWLSSWKPYSSWVNLASKSRDDFPLLFAIVEHRAWVTSIENYLKNGFYTQPLMNCNECRLGIWLATENVARYGKENIENVTASHQKIHTVAQELCKLYDEGKTTEVSERCEEFYILRESLLEKLKIFTQV